MKKFLLVLFAFTFIGALLTGCKSKEYEIALITDKGNIDDKSFNCRLSV